ncbi:MAG: hypothetical protein B7X86_02635 [Sphingobacteriales bacterium 17-39-43]|nr:MAG: hypothetical protein B7Y24_02635 [Sphingobacteriales bacterium 16-39-50]OZA26641.1 MAG: hypothetical protein B7X86_02635 [Sphingobacteriales bacterium 17-39-43]
MKAQILYPAQCLLGEGPLWHAERNSCFWVDIESGILFEYQWIRNKIAAMSSPIPINISLPSKPHLTKFTAISASAPAISFIIALIMNNADISPTNVQFMIFLFFDIGFVSIIDFYFRVN